MPPPVIGETPCGCSLTAGVRANCNTRWQAAQARLEDATTPAVPRQDITLYDRSGTARWRCALWPASIEGGSTGYRWRRRPFSALYIDLPIDQGFVEHEAATDLAVANRTLAQEGGQYREVILVNDIPNRPAAPCEDRHDTGSVDVPWRVRVIAQTRGSLADVSAADQATYDAAVETIRGIYCGDCTSFQISQCQTRSTADNPCSLDSSCNCVCEDDDVDVGCSGIERDRCNQMLTTWRQVLFIETEADAAVYGPLCSCWTRQIACSPAQIAAHIRDTPAGMRYVDSTWNDVAVTQCTANYEEIETEPCGGRTTCSEAAQARLATRATDAGRTIQNFTYRTSDCTCVANLVPLGTGDDTDDEEEEDDEEPTGPTGPTGPTDCTTEEQSNCVANNTPTTTYTASWNAATQSCDCTGCRTAIGAEDLAACQQNTSCSEGQYVWASVANCAVTCECRDRTTPEPCNPATSTRDPCVAHRNACSAADALAGQSWRWIADSNQNPCGSCSGRCVRQPCTNTCPHGQFADINANPQCSCRDVPCNDAVLTCPEGQRRYINAQNRCDCEAIPTPPPSECPEGCSGAFGLWNRQLLQGNLRINGELVNALTLCDAIGARASYGFYWDSRNCCCRPICTAPGFPIYNAAERRCEAPTQIDQGDQPCPQAGQFRNEDGDCVDPPTIEDPVDPEEPPVVIPVAPPPPPPPPTPTPPCAKFRSTVNWYCVRDQSTTATAALSEGSCGVPTSAITPKSLLNELACQTLANTEVGDGFRASAQIWLQRN